MRVDFCSKRMAEEAEPDPSVAVISITNYKDPSANLKPGWLAVLRVQFDDIDPGRNISPFLKADMLSVYRPMTEEQAEEILGFADVMVGSFNEATGILVHCEMGVSRSAAVAKFLRERYGLPEDEPDERFHNPHVYRLLKQAAEKTP